jgi:hypothetical protein
MIRGSNHPMGDWRKRECIRRRDEKRFDAELYRALTPPPPAAETTRAAYDLAALDKRTGLVRRAFRASALRRCPDGG